jgi:hypothetical protein
MLVEAGPRILPSFDERLSEKARRSLEALVVDLLEPVKCRPVSALRPSRSQRRASRLAKNGHCRSRSVGPPRARSASVPACYLAEQHGANRRDFYFVTEDIAGLEGIARAVAEALSFALAIERRSLAEVAPIILPTEAIGELGLEVSADARVRPTRFEFWGADTSLTKLRAELERRGYRYVGFDPGVRELRMIKPVPIDGPGFLAVLKEIAPLARSLGCSYRGTETVEGSDQFALNRPLTDRYADTAKGVLGWFFGKKSR